MRRLYSTFAGGWPGTGLLFMRLVVGAALVVRGLASLGGDSPLQTLQSALLAALGLLLMPGLWTPVIGTCIALLEALQAITTPGDPWVPVLLGTIGAALAMLGPGLWSIDARLFGWRRVEPPPRRVSSI